MSRRRTRRSRLGLRRRLSQGRWLLALGLVVIALIMLRPAERPPRDPDDLCAIFSEKRHWYVSARRSSEAWGVSEAVMLAILYQESGFRARAVPPRRKILWVLPWLRPSSAYGYSQALDSTWQDYRDRTGSTKAKRDDFGDAVHFVGWYASEIHRMTSISKDDASNLYLAYHEGPRGYSRDTHQNKAWLRAAARKVEERAGTYQSQYETCEQRLRRQNRFRMWLANL
jgi:hypothetical protein